MVRLKRTSENLEKSEKPKIPFQVEGTLMMIFDRVGLGAGGGWQG